MKNLYTTLAAILLITSSIFAQTLVASYPFNGNANDASGNNNNGTVNGATLTTDRFGNANSAYNFNGNSNFIQVANSASLQLGSHFTISAWSKLAAYNTSNYQGNFILSKGTDVGNAMSFNLTVGEIDNNVNPDPNGYKRFIFFNNPTGAAPYAQDGDTLVAPQIELNTWYYTVASVNGNVMKVYVNGRLIETKTFTSTLNASNTLDLFIGRQNFADPAAYWWNGSLDDIKIYNGALTDAQVSDSFATQSLVASYPFNGNANDVSGFGNNGTVMGATLTTDRFGNANSAYLFNGTSNWIEVANSASLQLGNTFTISAWVNHNGFYNGNYQGNFYVSKGNNDNVTTGEFALASGETDGNPNPDPTGYKIFYFNNTLSSGTYAQVLSDSPAVKLNRWYYVVITANIYTLKLYVDGKLMATKTNAGAINANNADKLFLGRQNKVGFEYWLNGVLDDVKIYNSVLPATSIFDSYVNDLKKPGSGNALQFDGSTNYVESPRSDNFAFGTSFSANAWIKTTDFEGDIVCNFEEASPYQGFLFGIGFGSVGNSADPRAGKLGFYVANSTVGGSYNDLTGNRVDDGKWHHVAVTYNGSNVAFYIDGNLSSTVSATNIPIGNSSNVLRIGRDNNNPGVRYLNGQVDELQLWNITLTQTQIRDWMCKKVTSAHPAYANLFAYYRLDEGSGTSTYSVGGHPGTLVNSPTWVTSAASLGDASAYDYTNATKTASIGSPTGETFTVTSTLGNPAGIQVYRVDTLPNTLTGTIGTGGNHKYFGVFQSGGTSPLYSAVYNYAGYAAISGNDPNGFRLYRRINNADILWTDAVATLNTTNKTLTVAGASTEYMLGSILNPLPLKLISFSAIKNGSDVILNWQTANEENLKNYVVEKSIDARKFTQLAVVNANDNPGTNNYTATDMNPVNGVNYYRLKQIDVEGNYTYSDIRSANFSDNLKVFISPNPAINNIKIYSDQMLKSVQVMDMSGKIIKWLIPTSNNLYDVSDLQKGIYFLRITTNTETQTLRLAKL